MEADFGCRNQLQRRLVLNKKNFGYVAVAVSVVAATLAVYYLFFGLPHWQFGIDDADKGVENKVFNWVGASEPVLTIHEYLDFDCPHCPDTHKILRRLIARKFEKIRLVRHDYARMGCAPNNEEDRKPTCELVRGSICAGKQMDYWKWNDLLIESPRFNAPDENRKYLKNMAEKAGLDLEKFESCLYSSDTVLGAHYIYTEAKKQKLQGTPTYIVDGKKLSLKEVKELIDEL